MVINSMITQIALISGFMLSLANDKIFNGNNSYDGPLTKLLIITSSNERVKEIKKAAIILGVTSGIKIFEKICQSEAPRSLAASNILTSIFLNPKNMIKLAKGAVRAACDKNILINPKLILKSIKSINRLTAKIISGKTIIDWILKKSNFLPGNLYLYIANELKIPKRIASIEEVIANIKEFLAAFSKLVFDFKL